MRSKVWPALFKNRPSKDPLRIWIPGCSTGEEAYSVAISLYDYLHEKGLIVPIQIFGTDLNELAIEKARVGVYIKSALQNVAPQHLNRYFMKTNGNYQIIKSIRDVSIFAPHNLLKDPPFSRMDLISCQNVLIYLEPAAQQKILESFHYALKPGGMLMLGKSESIGSSSDLFKPLDKAHKVYMRKPAPPHFNFDFAMGGLPDIYLNAETPEQVKGNRQTELKSEDNLEKEIDQDASCKICSCQRHRQHYAEHQRRAGNFQKRNYKALWKETTTINEELMNRNEELRTSRDYAEAMVSTTREPIIVLSYDLRVHSANKAFYKFFHVSAEETEGHFLNETEHELLDVVELRKQLRTMRSNLKQKHNFGIKYTSHDKEKRMLHVNAHALELEGSQAAARIAGHPGFE